ncbi:MAG TPA: DUF2087 domain-containing protein [Paucimonas sp.]|nr:DUF2087 domain-containing protein [Paucimonas sp.]
MSDDTLQRFQAVAIKKNVLLSSLGEQELGAVALSASRCIGADAVVSEKAFTQALAAWLGGTGAMLKIDAVELRRTLVDLQFILRDSYGREYRRNPDFPARFDAPCRALAAVDLDAAARAARNAEDERRSQRKIAQAGRS